MTNDLDALMLKYPAPWTRKQTSLVRVLDKSGQSIAVAEIGSPNDELWSGLIEAVNLCHDQSFRSSTT